MTALWQLSRVPQFDASGAIAVGAQAFFYNVGTTTPQTTYSDSGLSTVSTHDSDGAVVADGGGRFPAIYLNSTPGTYRQRVLDADGNVLFDDDGISVPQAADYVPPDAGSTDVTLLARTGDVKAKHGTAAESGWVRAAGRTIGSATSGATERANADTSALYSYLYNADTTLTVSTGRGANAAADFAANKTIALPDYRERALVGLADMGNTATTLLSGNTVDNSETTITLGATVGAGTHTLTTAEQAAHTHTGTTSSSGAHNHDFNVHSGDTGPSNAAADGNGAVSGTDSTTSVAAHTHTFTTASSGGGGAHANVQPSVLVTYYLKL